MAIKELDSAPELRDNPALKDFNDVTGLAKSFIDTKAFVGQSLRPVGPDASPEAKKDFYEKLKKHAPHLVPMDDTDEAAQELVWERLGKPKDPKEYAYKLPEDVTVDLEALRSAAQVAGLTKKQFEKLAAKTVEGAQKEKETLAGDRAALKTEWGAAYADKLKTASAIAAKLGAPEDVVQRIAAGQMTSGQLKLWDGIAKGFGAESTVIGKQTGGGSGALTPAEAQMQLEEIMSNPAYFDKRHPTHGSLVRKAIALQAAVSGEQAP